jgi:hypothetical protein
MHARATARQMTRPELRVFLQDWFCGCGEPDEAAKALLRLLRLHPLFDNREAFEAWLPDVGLQNLVLYSLDRKELTEHGGSVGGGWLTPLGEQVLSALAAEEADGFEALTEMHCAHGYDIDDREHVCQ